MDMRETRRDALRPVDPEFDLMIPIILRVDRTALNCLVYRIEEPFRTLKDDFGVSGGEIVGAIVIAIAGAL